MTNDPQELQPNHVQDLLELQDFKSLRLLFKELELADISDTFAQLDTRSCIALFRLVPRARRAELYSHLPLELQTDLIAELPTVIISSLLNEMDPDDRTRLFETFDEQTRNEVVAYLNPQEQAITKRLLSYPEGSIGRLMTPDFMVLNQSMSVAQALQHVHWNVHLPEEYLHQLFIVDASGILQGEVTLATLVTCDPSSKLLRDVMRRSSVAFRPEQEDQEAIDIFQKYDRLYVPVIDDSRRVIGLVTADDVFDLAQDEATEDIQQFGGHSALEDSYFQTPISTMFWKRAGWLAFLFLSSVFCGETIRLYESSLAKWGFLAFFLPIITSAGGTSGTQAASLIIRGLAIRELQAEDAFRVLVKELTIALFLGSCLAVMGFGIALFWDLSHEVGTVVFSALLCVVVFGVVSGSMLPFIFSKLKLDPAVVSSPFITTLVDLTGIMILFKIAVSVLS